MLLDILHHTLYRFDPPARHVTQSLRLRPSRCASQQVLHWSVHCSGAYIGASHVDGAGDQVDLLSLHGPVESMRIEVQGQVRTEDTAGVLRGHAERIPPLAYLRPTPATRADAALQALASSALADIPADDPLSRAHRLSQAVAEAIRYQPGSTHAHTTAAEALAEGQGVCQDQSHALIALARCSGLPARYVTGYLYAPQAGLHLASHAWAEIHVAGLGWVGFDVANRCCPDERHVRLGSGLDARLAAPIRGVVRGQGSEALDVEVTIGEAQQQ